MCTTAEHRSSVHLRADRGAPQGQETAQREPDEADAPQEEPGILCRACLHPITRVSERIAVQGSHRHTFANPHGLVFEIGCFRQASGCAAAGAATDEFTWFAGYSWRVCVCSACLVHLGWRFSSRSGDVFHGLIVDRLIEPS
jgi:hypothetical protein